MDKSYNINVFLNFIILVNLGVIAFLCYVDFSLLQNTSNLDFSIIALLLDLFCGYLFNHALVTRSAYYLKFYLIIAIVRIIIGLIQYKWIEIQFLVFAVGLVYTFFGCDSSLYGHFQKRNQVFDEMIEENKLKYRRELEESDNSKIEL